MRAPTAFVAAATLAAACIVRPAAAQPGSAYAAGAPAAALTAHCLSRNPGRLGLTDGQEAWVAEIVRTIPRGPEQRRAILAVLTHTQQILYWNTAGIALC